MSAGVDETITTETIAAWLRAFAAAAAANREYLTDLDAAIGDADHGINMDRGMQAVAAKLGDGGGASGVSGAAGAATAAADIGALLKTVGMTLVSTVGGAAGPLYGTFFLQLGKAAGDAAELDLERWAAAFRAGVEGVQMRGKARPGDKTMVDALLPAAAALDEAAAAGRPLPDALRAAAEAAGQGALATVPLVARKGRASYLGERSAGHQDPGATSSWLLLEAAAGTLAGGSATARDMGTTAGARGPSRTPGR
jgi:phosphoenolpyruvate---glycerone phosphotransferase subunit DhaL